MFSQGACRPWQGGEILALAHYLDRRVQITVLAECRLEGDDLFLRSRVRLAQGFGVLHPMQVADRRPGAGKVVIQFFAGTQDGIEAAWRRVRQKRVDAGLVTLQQCVDGRFDMLCGDGRERGQGGTINQGVAHASIRYAVGNNP